LRVADTSTAVENGGSIRAVGDRQLGSSELKKKISKNFFGRQIAAADAADAVSRAQEILRSERNWGRP
jgi:hypothetical protein